MKITDACISCGACADACPNDAISAGADAYIINQEDCADCEVCIDVCPNDAIERS